MSNKSEPYLTADEAAAMLRLSPKTLERMRVEGSDLRYYKAGKGKRARVLYLASDIQEWLAGHAYNSTSEYK